MRNWPIPRPVVFLLEPYWLEQRLNREKVPIKIMEISLMAEASPAMHMLGLTDVPIILVEV